MTKTSGLSGSAAAAIPETTLLDELSKLSITFAGGEGTSQTIFWYPRRKLLKSTVHNNEFLDVDWGLHISMWLEEHNFSFSKDALGHIEVRVMTAEKHSLLALNVCSDTEIPCSFPQYSQGDWSACLQGALNFAVENSGIILIPLEEFTEKLEAANAKRSDPAGFILAPSVFAGTSTIFNWVTLSQVDVPTEQALSPIYSQVASWIGEPLAEEVFRSPLSQGRPIDEVLKRRLTLNEMNSLKSGMETVHGPGPVINANVVFTQAFMDQEYANLVVGRFVQNFASLLPQTNSKVFWVVKKGNEHHEFVSSVPSCQHSLVFFVHDPSGDNQMPITIKTEKWTRKTEFIEPKNHQINLDTALNEDTADGLFEKFRGEMIETIQKWMEPKKN